ncbi:hypothetical protein V6N13_032393 [Hibiscus sabdariffa]
MLLKLFVQAGKASLVQSAAAPTQSVIVGKHIDGVSSTNNSLCDNAKAESREQKFDADMLQRNAGAGADTLKALALGLANVIGGLIILGHNSDDKVLKLAVMAGASLVCIILLALGKAHVRKPQRRYFRTVLYYVCLGILASGISYLVGELMKKLAEQVGLFESISAARVPLLDQNTIGGGTAAY